jgi:hypothetical protein
MENVMNKFFVTQVSNEVFVVVLAALLSLVIIHLLIASSIPAILSGITGLYVIRRELLTT